MIKGIMLRFADGSTTTIAMPTVLASQVTNEDSDGLQQLIDVTGVRVIDDGFVFVIALVAGMPHGEMQYLPERFDEFRIYLSTTGKSWPVILTLDSAGATTIFRTFSNWVNIKLAEVFERDIQAGELTFEEARKIRKDVFDVPKFQRFLAHRFKVGDMPKGKKGKRRVHDRAEEELYALACRIYRDASDVSFEVACSQATENRPDLVPDGWRSDPCGNLKREAARYWDKSPYSQLSYRQSRDG